MNYPRWFQVFHLMISVFKNLSLFTLFAALFIRSDRPKKWLSLNQSHTLDFSLSFMSAWLGCVCLYVCVCVRVYASVCWILTAITSDTKWLFSEGFAPFHVVIASLWWRRGPLLHAALSHDSCNIYMFTLTISICCFWNNQQPGAWREARGTAVSRAQLGFHDWEAGPDYARLGGGGGRGGEGARFLSFKALSRFLTEGWERARALGIRASSPSERSFTRVRSATAGP